MDEKENKLILGATIQWMETHWLVSLDTYEPMEPSPGMIRLSRVNPVLPICFISRVSTYSPVWLHGGEVIDPTGPGFPVLIKPNRDQWVWTEFSDEALDRGHPTIIERLGSGRIHQKAGDFLKIAEKHPEWFEGVIQYTQTCLRSWRELVDRNKFGASCVWRNTEQRPTLVHDETIFDVWVHDDWRFTYMNYIGQREAFWVVHEHPWLQEGKFYRTNAPARIVQKNVVERITSDGIVSLEQAEHTEMFWRCNGTFISESDIREIARELGSPPPRHGLCSEPGETSFSEQDWMLIQMHARGQVVPN